MAKFYTAILFLFLLFAGHSQNKAKSFTVKFIDGTIKPDGILDETIWETAEGPYNFQQYFPSDSILAIKQTEIKMLYSNTHLYVAIKGYAEGRKFNTRSLQRDFRGGGIDQISLVFDA